MGRRKKRRTLKKMEKRSFFVRVCVRVCLGRGWCSGLPERSLVGGRGKRCADREAQELLFTSRLIAVEDENEGGYLSLFFTVFKG